jgi:hypothetical protein
MTPRCLTFVREPGLEESFDLAGAGHECGIAARTFSLGDIDCEISVGFEGSGSRGAVVCGCSAAATSSCVHCGRSKLVSKKVFWS